MEKSNDIYATINNHRLTNPIGWEERRLVISPVVLQTARAFAVWTRRDLTAPADAELVLGVRDSNATLAGVVFAGSPSSWRDDDGATVEILCLATDGTLGAERALLGGVWWAARVKGYERMLVSAYPGGARAGQVLWVARTVGGRR
ncbi:XF1762 family protein [Nonomuraea sp. NPDC049714]|uniref:XF1762 family protein n=1 Tax=Nonomuraea sp. NPDC049714 TaxID=3364357 RepID=UPI0037931C19